MFCHFISLEVALPSSLSRSTLRRCVSLAGVWGGRQKHGGRRDTGELYQILPCQSTGKLLPFLFLLRKLVHRLRGSPTAHLQVSKYTLSVCFLFVTMSLQIWFHGVSELRLAVYFLSPDCFSTFPYHRCFFDVWQKCAAKADVCPSPRRSQLPLARVSPECSWLTLVLHFGI